MKVFGKIFLSILLIIFSLVLTYSQTEQYKFRHLTTKQGLPSNRINDIVKDRHGIMWFATDNGLARYDGHNIKVYQNSDDTTSISGNIIRAVHIDDDGTFWVGTKENGLNLFNTITGKFSRFYHDSENPKSLSSNSINAIYRDRKGILWIATNGGGINRYDQTENCFVSFKQKAEGTDNSKNIINCIYEDSSGNFWIGTKDRLFQFNRVTVEFTMFEPSRDIPPGNYRTITSILEDKHGVLWIGSYWGLFKYDRRKQQTINFLPEDIHKSATGKAIHRFNLSNLYIRSIVEDYNQGEQYLWIATNWGLNKFDLKTENCTLFLVDPKDPNGIATSFLNTQFLDDVGQLWIGTIDAGIEVVNLTPNPFHHVNMMLPNFQFDHSTASFLVDSEGYIWKGAIDEGLFKYDQDFNIIGNYKKFEFTPDNPHNNRIDCLYEDSEKNLWLGFFEWGLVNFDKTNNTFRPVKLIIDQAIPKPNTIVNIIQDHTGKLWIGTNVGLYYKNQNDGITTPAKYVRDDILKKANIVRIYEDRKQNLWISTKNFGLFCLQVNNRPSSKFTRYHESAKHNKDFFGNSVNTIYEDRSGTIWFGTDKGLNKFNFKNNKFEADKKFNEDYQGSIISIYGDNKNNLWIFHFSKGLIRYNPYTRNKNIVKVYNVNDGLPFDKFNSFFSYLNSFYQSKDGRLFMSGGVGTGDGFFWFHPDSINDNKHIPNVIFTNFNIGDEELMLDSNIIDKQHITLKHNQNFFSFEFAALDFMDPEKNQYAYFLEGYEKEWIFSGTRRFANYTGVPPGNFTFRVKGSNNDGYWNEEGTYVRITILPPFWRTWWAYCIYALVFIVIIYSILRFYLRRQRLLHSLEIEQVETEKLKELDSLKTKFFANISHEFRTPLTLILGPLQQLISKVKNPSDKQTLSMVHQNAHRLKDLVSQLLSLSKLESGKMKLQCTETNIIEFVRTFVQSFESLAKHEVIDLVFTSSEKEILVFLDKEKLAQVLNNLLSNAFKFTEEGGRIEISITTLENGKGVNISISDTGQGISSDKLEHIFDRFYQADDSISREKEGTGIGLAIVKEMVNLHHGKIESKSTIGKGTTFSICLPLGSDHLKPEELKKSNDTDADFEHTTFIQRKSNIDDTDLTDENGIESLLSLLIVEDNPDMRTFIRGYFDNEFKILEAGDGQAGLKIAVDHIPDMIISDVMMPKMDGYEFCQKIKTDVKTSHIPVILLTARATKESRMEGLETGADDFITKPFDGEELQVRVKNLIEQRKKLSGIYRKDFEIVQQNKKERVFSMDEKFLQKAKSVVGKNISNSEYGVEEFASDMALSRFQLHRKLGALINQPTTEFIRTIRLNFAIDLLKKRSGTISEIAYDAGFNNPTYFSISFKKHFGKSPKEYINQMDQKKNI